MLSRAACVPRVCLSCRLGLFQARAAALRVPRLSPCQDGRQIRRRHGSARDDLVVQSKERIEALISGRVFESKDDQEGKQTQKKKKGSRGGAAKSKATAKSKSKSKSKSQSKSQSKSKSKSRSKADQDEDLPDWGFTFSKDKKGVRAQIKRPQDVGVTNTPVGQPIEIEEPVIEEIAVPAPEKNKPEPQVPEPELPMVEALEELQAEEPQVEEFPIEQPRIEKLEIEEAVKEDPELFNARRSKTKPFVQRVRRQPRRRYHDELVHAKFLGKEALGRPLDALMVKNPNRMKKPKKPIRMLEEEKMAEAVDLRWQDLMPRVEEHDDLMNEAVQNIEALRPVDTAILSMKDFDHLQSELVEGYTYNQLVAYFHRKLKTLDTHRNEPAKYDWIIEQTPWEPSEPDHWETLTPKLKYSMMIVRNIWNIEIKEQVEGLGRLQIWLRPEIFRLITDPQTPVLRSLAAKYLYKSNKERLEGSVDESRLDIFARKSIMPVLLARLDEIASSITLQKMSTEGLEEEDLAPRMLQEVARITGTLIHYDEESAELQVSWLANDGRRPSIANQGQASSQTESPADVALRLLMGRRAKEREQQQTSVQILTRSGESETHDRRFLTHQRETRSMSWREKLQSWFRYVAPVGKQPIEELEPAADFSNKISLPESSAKATRSADDARTEIITATFGHILHDKPVAEEEKGGMAETRRILSPVVPHPAALTPITRETVKPVSQHTSIILNFTPSLSTPTTTPTSTTTKPNTKAPQKPAGRFPELELRLPVDRDADLSSFSFPPESTLHGIFHTHVHDVLLPGESVDVRLARHALLPLDVETQPLGEFLAACDFNLVEGRLRTPSRAVFSIPSSWGPSTRGRKPKKPVDVAYRFTGLELHQVVEVEWRGHTLKYTSIEAGQHGGKRQELSLRAAPPAPPLPSALDKKDKTQYFQLVEDLASGKHFSWHQGFKSMRVRPGKEGPALEEEPEELELRDEEEEEAQPLEGETPALALALGEDQESPQGPLSTTEKENDLTEEPAAGIEDVESAATAEKSSTEASTLPESPSPSESQSGAGSSNVAVGNKE